MGAALPLNSTPAHTASPFDLGDDTAYRCWRAHKLAQRPVSADELIVDVADPRALQPAERSALLALLARCNMAVYRSPVVAEDKALPLGLAAQLGMTQLDANWLADEDGISSIAISDAHDGRGGFIPYTNRAIRWHTDGYYHPAERRICGMVLHCVRPAASGGVNRADGPGAGLHRAARRQPGAHARPDAAHAMTIPAREDDGGVARAAQAGPVFAVNADGSLHMRYTARTRSIEWAPMPLVQVQAVAAAGACWTVPRPTSCGCA
jgi:hypothetical protein